jgi:hypothetical protein
MINAHTKGDSNWTRELHRASIFELIKRRLIEL